jgi:predicted DNA-binding ArsR family transcriptional regulator
MSYISADSLRGGSGRNWFGSAAGWVPSWCCSQAVSRTVWHTLLLCVQWKTPDDGQRKCPKHVDFYSKNKLEKLLQPVGFIVRKNLKDAVRGQNSNRIGCSQAVSKLLWHIPLLCVQWKTPDDGQRNCPKHVEFYSKNKFEKLVYLKGKVIPLQARCGPEGG